MLGAHDGDFPGVIKGDGILLIGFDVLLVEDDEPDVLQGGEHRASGPDDDGGLPLGDFAVFVIFLRRGQLAMEDRDVPLEAAGEILDHDRGEADLRHEHEDVLPLLEIGFG